MNNDKYMVSVAMAVYNGEKYIKEQIDSILCQLSENDELVISYNKSNDRTLEIIEEYKHKDSRIHVVVCHSKGVITNFNNAIANSKGNIIFLCDQDDIWENNKVECVLSAFKNSEETVLVEHNCQFIDSDGNEIDGDLFFRRRARKGLVKNLVYNSYQGSCMAFKRELVQYICPIPLNISMHDQWIGLIGEKCGGVLHLNKKLIRYRRHGETVSNVRVGLFKKVRIIAITYYQLNKRMKTVRKVKQVKK